MALSYQSSLGRYRRYLQVVQNKPLWAASLWVILSLILLIVLIVLALRPTLITISSLIGQINQQQAISKQLDDKILKVSTALKNMDAVKDQVPLLDKAIPKDTQWDDLTLDLEKIATDSGLEATSVTIEKIPLVLNEPTTTNGTPIKILVPNGVLPIRFTLTASGEYDQIRKCISEIENMSRVVMISNVIIDTNKDGGLDLTVSGQAAYLPDNIL